MIIIIIFCFMFQSLSNSATGILSSSPSLTHSPVTGAGRLPLLRLPLRPLDPQGPDLLHLLPRPPAGRLGPGPESQEEAGVPERSSCHMDLLPPVPGCLDSLGSSEPGVPGVLQIHQGSVSPPSSKYAANR